MWSGLALWPRPRRRGDFSPTPRRQGRLESFREEPDSEEPAPPRHHLVQATPSMAKFLHVIPESQQNSVGTLAEQSK